MLDATLQLDTLLPKLELEVWSFPGAWISVLGASPLLGSSFKLKVSAPHSPPHPSAGSLDLENGK